jgi:ribokinase
MQTFGGKGANQAVAAARAGGDVTFVTCLGDDAYAQMCIDNFRRDGIDTSSIVRRKNAQTGVALVMFDEQGRNYLAIASGANHAMTSVDIELAESVIRESAMVVLQNEITPEAAMNAMHIASETKVPVMLNYAPVGATPIPITDKIRCLVVNETEAAQLAGQEVKTMEHVKSAAARLSEMGPPVVIITIGPHGSFVRHQGHELHIPAFKVKPVDTTAAGDTYCGALAVGLLEGMDWLEAARFATAASAISVTRMGAQPSIPKRGEIDAFLLEHAHG